MSKSIPSELQDLHVFLSSIILLPSAHEACEALKNFESSLLTHQFPIDNIILKHTRRISQKFSHSLYMIIPQLYITYLKQVDKSNKDLLISLCNDALLVKESLLGTEKSDQISSSVREVLIVLIQQGNLDAQQAQVVQSLLEVKQSFNFEEELSSVIEEISVNSSIGLHMMIDLFSTMQTVKDQYYYFSSQIGLFIKSLHNKRSVEIYTLTLKFLDILLPPIKYLIKLEENEVEYQLSHLKLFSVYEDVFYTSVELLKILMVSDKYVNESSIRIIQKLWYLYPNLRSSLYDIVVNNLKTINNSNSLDPRRRAAEFLYEIMHDKQVEGDFKGILESSSLDNIFEDESYEQAQLQSVSLKDLRINAGFPICSDIKPGEKFTYYVEVENENSILFWGFATEDYNISYTISRMDAVIKVLYSGEKVECDQTPVIGSLLATTAGLYRFEWDNSFSWFRGKKIRFRICVLTPTIHKAPNENRVISVINPDDVGDLCYILSDQTFTEIGILVCSDSLHFLIGNASSTIAISDPDSIPQLISDFCQKIEGKVKKIGIIEKNPVPRCYDLMDGCFASCRDVDAFALANHELIGAHTLIAVLNLEGVRSAVVIGGRLFGAGDVSNLKNQEPAVAVSTLLSLFGPATVVVGGLDVEKLVARVRLLVPINIWNHSKIILSNLLPVDCAAKLHYLLYKYRAVL